MAERVTKGERRSSIDAASWNEFVDAAEKIKRLPPPGGKAGAVSTLSRALTIACKNTSGADYTADFPIVRLVDPVITPADYANVVHQHLVLEVDDPDATNAHWGVMQGPCVNGKQQQTVVYGYTWATVNIASTSHTTCGPTSGEATKLTSGKSGAAIVYKPAGTGDKTCLIRIGGSIAHWVVATLDADMTSGGPTNATVVDYGGPPGVDGYPGDSTMKVKLESNFAQNHTTGTKLFGVLSDPASDPPTYEVPKDDGSGGSGSLPDAGCGLEYTDATTLDINFDKIAGFGLGYGTGGFECELESNCCLYVQHGCGLMDDGNGRVAVDTVALAGKGLIASNDSDCPDPEGVGAPAKCCLHVGAGCGITVEDDLVSVNRDALIGCGLKLGSGSCDIDVDMERLAGKGLIPGSSVSQCDSGGSDPEFPEYCCLMVNIGCGLKFVDPDGDLIIVDNDALAGPGLTPSGTCALAANVDGTYISINVSNEITLDLSALCTYIASNCGEEVEVITGCATPFVTFDASGNPTFHFTKKTVRVLTQAAASDAECVSVGVLTC